MSLRLAALAAAALVVGGVSSSAARADWYINLTQQGVTGISLAPGGDAYIRFYNAGTSGGYTKVSAEIHNTLVDPHATIAAVVFNIASDFFSTINWTLTTASNAVTGMGERGEMSVGAENSQVLSNSQQGQMKNFDVLVTYPPLNGGGGNDKFESGEQSTWTFYSTSSLFTADAFVQGDGSLATNMYGSFLGGAFIQTDDGSAHTGGTSSDPNNPPPRRDPGAVPVPASIIGLLTMGAGLFAFRRMVSIA